MLKGLKNAWLSPIGQMVIDHEEIFDFSSYHEELSAFIIKDQYKLKDQYTALTLANKKGFNFCMEMLENKGWIRLHGFGSLIPMWIIPYNKKITKAQENLILNWCIENNRKYSTCFY